MWFSVDSLIALIICCVLFLSCWLEQFQHFAFCVCVRVCVCMCLCVCLLHNKFRSCDIFQVM